MRVMWQRQKPRLFPLFHYGSLAMTAPAAFFSALKTTVAGKKPANSLLIRSACVPRVGWQPFAANLILNSARKKCVAFARFDFARMRYLFLQIVYLCTYY